MQRPAARFLVFKFDELTVQPVRTPTGVQRPVARFFVIKFDELTVRPVRTPAEGAASGRPLFCFNSSLSRFEHPRGVQRPVARLILSAGPGEL